LRLIGLSKTYKTGLFGKAGPNDVKALKNTYLEVSENELFAILGHKGAGKTTLINILTGLMSQSSGEAFICGLKLSTQMNEI
jgi:ABC-type multidrug transport system ATPase subunit